VKLYWYNLFKQLSLLIAAALVVGLLVKQPGWVLALALLLYILWSSAQVSKLIAWLRDRTHSVPPESRGIWAEVFDNIYHLQRRNKETQARLQAVLNRIQDSATAIQDAVVMMDSDGNIEWWNPAAEKLLGFQSPDDGGQVITNLLRHPRFISYFKSSNYSDPIQIPSPVNERIQLQLQITLFGNNERIMFGRDVSRIHHLEQMRQDFIANVSHELRTPLTVIVGYLETMTDFADQLPKRWQRPLVQMVQQSKRMENLVSDLLLLSRLETTANEQDHHPIDAASLLETIRQDAIALSGPQQHHIELIIDSHNKLRGQDGEIRSAFSNLIFNAVKYTPAGGRIVIHWWQDNEGIHLSVKDNGIGIDSKHLPRITERFYRADSSRATNTDGTGLGLAIVKHVLLRHEGQLQVDSELGRGSTFSCHFPLSRCVSSTPLYSVPR